MSIELPMTGYWSDWSGACRQVEIIAETLDGKYVIRRPLRGLSIVAKNKVKLEKEVN